MGLFPISSYASGAEALRPVETGVTPAPSASSAATAQVNVVAVPAPVKEAAAATSALDVERPAEKKKLDQAVDAINKFLTPVASNIQFSIDEASGRTLVKVVDTATNDVLRQFPSKEALAISQQLDKLQGLLLRDKA